MLIDFVGAQWYNSIVNLRDCFVCLKIENLWVGTSGRASTFLIACYYRVMLYKGAAVMSETCDPVGAVPACDKKNKILKKALSGESTVVLYNKDIRTKFEMRLCGTDRHEEILKLQREVSECISDEDTFVLTTAEELAESLDRDFCIGAFMADELVAFTLMVSNRESYRNIGGLFDETNGAAQASVTYDTTFVCSRYVGYGLQRYFITLKDNVAVLLGADKAYATVSPNNAVSLKNLRSNGFRTVGKKRLYGRHWRYILCKRLDKSDKAVMPVCASAEEEGGLYERDLPGNKPR